MEPESISFEEAYKRLEEIVRALESKDMPIDQAVELYEVGVKLIRQCNAQLDSAELRIRQLSGVGDGEPRLTPMVDAK